MNTLPLVNAATPAADAPPAAPMTAGDVLDALYRRWNPEEYVHVHEAPDSADRGGRKLDAVVFSCWRSRGFEIDGVEVKASMSDLRRELAQAAKADWWWAHVHRFWVAVPAPLADRVAVGDIDWPTGWGLLACSADAAPAVARKAAKHDAKPLPWGSVVGLLRAATGCGRNALYGAEQRGYQRGVEAGRARAERNEGDAFLRNQLDQLRAKLQAFEEASGLNVAADYNGRRLGDDVALLRRITRDPAGIASTIDRTVVDVRRQADQLAGLADVARQMAE